MSFTVDTSNTNSSTDTTPKRFKKCIVDGDTIIFRCAKFMQDDYIEVKHLGSGNIKEFKNRTSFGIRRGNIIPLKPEDIKNNTREDKDGNPQKWLAWLNHDRELKGQSQFSVEDFSVEDKARLTNNHNSYEEALKSSLDTAGFNIGSIKKFMDSEDYVFCIGAGKGNYRDYECKDVIYKGNRSGKPIYFEAFKEAFVTQYKTKIEQAVFCEAEDLLQHYANIEYAKYGDDFDKWTVCGAYIDKDVDHVFMPSFNYDNTDKGWRYPTEFECDKCLAVQSLSGDPTDNITGLEGLTDKVKTHFKLKKNSSATKDTATKILEGCTTTQEMWKRVMFCYQDYYGMDKIHKFKDVHGEEQSWTWLDYMQQCYVLIRMQERPDQVPSLRKYLSKIGVDVTEEISYDVVEVIDQSKLLEDIEDLEQTLELLKSKLKSYKSLNKGDMVKRLDEIVSVTSDLEKNISLLK